MDGYDFVWNTMGLYGLKWFGMDLYGFLDLCRDISLFHF